MTGHGPGRERKLDGKQEAHLVATACSSPPEGHVNWTLQLLADKVVELEFAGSISLETVRQIRKKTNSSRGGKKEWCIPKLSGEFVARMEDVLDPVSSTGQALYHEDTTRRVPVVCFDETSRQLVEDVRPPVKSKPGRVERYDTEYQRNGTRNLTASLCSWTVPSWIHSRDSRTAAPVSQVWYSRRGAAGAFGTPIPKGHPGTAGPCRRSRPAGLL